MTRQMGLLREYKLFILVFAVSALVFMPFLGEHWIHDSYLIARYGYFYMIPRLINQGRVVSSLFLRGLDAVSMPYVAAMSLSVALSLFILSLAAYFVYLTAKERGVSGKMVSAIALIGSAGMFFNLFVAETFLFFENAVMSLGALCAVLAARAILRGKYAPAFVLAVLSVFCYQAAIAYFLPLVLLFPAEPRKKIMAFAVYAFALVSNYVFTRMVSTDVRVSGSINLWENIRNCYFKVRSFFGSTLGMTPRFLFFLFIFSFAVIILVGAVKSKRIWPVVRAVLACGALVVCAMLPHVMMSYFYVAPRSAVALAGIGGLLIVAMANGLCELEGTGVCEGTGDEGCEGSVELRAERRRWLRGVGGFAGWLKLASLVLAAAFTVTIAGFQLDMQLSSLRNNELDALEIEAAAEEVRRYEARSGFVITHVYILHDSNTVYRRPEFRNYHDLTIRALSVSWMIAPHLSDALGRELQDRPTPKGAYQRLFARRKWDDFDPEQMVFDGNYVYFCIY